MPVCFFKKSSGTKPAAAAEPSKPKPSAAEEAAGGIMEHIITPGAEYLTKHRRLRDIQMVRYNFEDDEYDHNNYGEQEQMYYPNHASYNPHAVVAPPYYPGPGMRHVSARSSMPRPHHHCDCHSNYMQPPPPPPYAHYPPAQPQPHFSPAPPPWQRFSPAPPPPPWGSQFGPRQQFGPPRPHYGPPRRPFAPPPRYDYYGDY